MKTPERSVSEIVEEFEKKWKDDEFYSKLHEYEDINAITDWLTQTLKAERQKREELVEQAYKAGQSDLIYELDKVWDSETLQHMDTVILEAQAISDRLQALTQTNNPK